jgi:hypothetical protein
MSGAVRTKSVCDSRSLRYEARANEERFYEAIPHLNSRKNDSSKILEAESASAILIPCSLQKKTSPFSASTRIDVP